MAGVPRLLKAAGPEVPLGPSGRLAKQTCAGSRPLSRSVGKEPSRAEAGGGSGGAPGHHPLEWRSCPGAHGGAPAQAPGSRTPARLCTAPPLAGRLRSRLLQPLRRRIPGTSKRPPGLAGLTRRASLAFGTPRSPPHPPTTAPKTTGARPRRRFLGGWWRGGGRFLQKKPVGRTAQIPNQRRQRG